MYIGKRYLEGQQVDAQTLRNQPLRSDRIEEIFRRVKKRVSAE